MCLLVQSVVSILAEKRFLKHGQNRSHLKLLGLNPSHFSLIYSNLSENLQNTDILHCPQCIGPRSSPWSIGTLFLSLHRQPLRPMSCWICRGRQTTPPRSRTMVLTVFCIVNTLYILKPVHFSLIYSNFTFFCKS